jgi:hypothetical protein
MAGTQRQRAIAKALTALLPLAPYIDAEKIRADAYAPHLKTLPPSTAVWLAAEATGHQWKPRLLQHSLCGSTTGMTWRQEAARLTESPRPTL